VATSHPNRDHLSPITALKLEEYNFQLTDAATKESVEDESLKVICAMKRSENVCRKMTVGTVFTQSVFGHGSNISARSAIREKSSSPFRCRQSFPGESGAAFDRGRSYTMSNGIFVWVENDDAFPKSCLLDVNYH
jgi:hypothetical protein